MRSRVFGAMGDLSAYDTLRKLKSRFMIWILTGAAVVVVAPLVLVLFYIVIKGAPALNWAFFTEIPKPVGEEGGGVANALVGTATLVALGGFLGIPWGIGAGVYLSEYGRTRLATFIRFSVDILASIPSIIIGLFAYAIIVSPMNGFSALAGGFALGLLMVPTVVRSTEELLKLVPDHIREAGLGLGIPRWRVITHVVLRGSLGGIATGVMLAIARAAGETAPLLFTAFGNSFWSRGLDQPTASLPVQIYSYAISPFEDWHQKAWAAALVLVVFVLFLNVATRWFLRKQIRSGKAGGV